MVASIFGGGSRDAENQEELISAFYSAVFNLLEEKLGRAYSEDEIMNIIMWTRFSRKHTVYWFGKDSDIMKFVDSPEWTPYVSDRFDYDPVEVQRRQLDGWLVDPDTLPKKIATSRKEFGKRQSIADTLKNSQNPLVTVYRQADHDPACPTVTEANYALFWKAVWNAQNGHELTLRARWETPPDTKEKS